MRKSLSSIDNNSQQVESTLLENNSYTMTYAVETGAINRLYFRTPVFGAVFRTIYVWKLEWKFLAPKINVGESDVDDEFAATAAVL